MNIKQRRTIRKYTQQPVSDELLNRLIEEASRTQTMGNLQLYSVIVTRSEAMKERLAPAHFCQPMVTEVLLTKLNIDSVLYSTSKPFSTIPRQPPNTEP